MKVTRKAGFTLVELLVVIAIIVVIASLSISMVSKIRYDPAELAGFGSGTLKEFLYQGKFPVLFVDGHVEAVTPSDYLARKLYLVPIVPTP